MEAITRKEYWAEVRSLAARVAEESEAQDREWGEVLWETVDSHQWTIYTFHAMRVPIFSECEDWWESVKAGSCETEADVYCRMAFVCLYDDVANEIVRREDQ